MCCDVLLAPQLLHHAVDGKEAGQCRARNHKRERQVKALALPEALAFCISAHIFPRLGAPGAFDTTSLATAAGNIHTACLLRSKKVY